MDPPPPPPPPAVSSSILQFLENKTILVTGGAGFLAKIFVEKILRSQSKVKKLYLLIREVDNKSATQRLQNEVIGKELFKVLKQKMGAKFSPFVEEKVRVVAGDITCEDLAIKDPCLKQEIRRDIDVIVNFAATTNFDERYDVALWLNTFGGRNVMEFANKCLKIKVVIQVSTAYVSGERVGLIREDPYRLGDTLNAVAGLDVQAEKRLVEQKLNDLRNTGASDDSIKWAMKELGMERARKFGWPNVYVFTKAMGEMMMLDLKKDLIPLVIIRPTIVTSTFKEPFPGWVEGIRTIDSLVVGYGKGRLRCFLGDPTSVVDVIPADMVANVMIVAMATHANQRSAETAIYQVGSSVRNPVTLTVLHDTSHCYFTKHPWINKEGNPVIVGKVKVLGSMPSFHRYISIRYLLPLKGLELANTAFCQFFRGAHTDLSRKINYVLRLVDIYRPYLFFKGIYDDMNTHKLRVAAAESGMETNIFYFDPKVINWEDYFMDTHIPGLVRYVFK
ncbi:hypothetical protein Dimus_009398 [Dionaea muscipula]